ncbi:serine/threonine-protein kinase [Pseudonocardia yuanmonensis]
MFGPYRLEELLGRGGMGEVYRAFDTEHERDVAVKRLAPHLADEPEFQQRFRREAHHVAQLRNPHVITIHRYGQIEGQLYIDMQLVDGGDLLSLIERSGPLPVERAVKILEQIASALDEAHESGLVHRDVKPSNILLDGKLADFCYLADWGITRATTTRRSHSLTRTGALLGSLTYMAPEQFDGAVAHSSDIYALTCVFFEMITGKRPYSGDGLPVLMHAHMNVPPPRPSDVVPGTAMFDDVVATGMAKDASARYGTAGELARAARAALAAASQPAPAAVPTYVPVPETDVSPVPAPETDVSPVPAPETDVSPAGAPNTDVSPVRVAAVGGAAGAVASGDLIDPTRATRPATRPLDPPVAAAPGSGRRRLLPVTAALAAVAVLLAAWALLRGGGDTDRPPVAQALTPAPVTATIAPAAAPAATGPVITEAVYTGRTSGNELTLAVGIKDGRAAGYLCDGKQVEAWLEGTVTGDKLVLRGKTEANAVTATLDQRSALGTVTAGGVQRPFSAQLALGEAGLFESRRSVAGLATRIGWIVLPDGSQVGIAKRGDVREPAPALDPRTLQAVDGGETVTAQRLSGASTVLG